MSGTVSDKILVDVSGGDNAPGEIIKGAVLAVQNLDVRLVLVGREETIRNGLSEHTFPEDRIEILHATEIITPDEVPTVALKRKKDSSIVVALNALKERKAKAFVSAGSTGALLAGATLTVGRIPGIERPALAALLPNASGFSFLLDAGANVDAKPSYLLQFAQMGSVYMDNIMGIVNPKVGLVNIGAEKEKGSLAVKEAYSLLEKSSLNFIGNVEARDIPFGVADVLVCDAFVGNIILKYTEGLAESLLKMIKTELMKGTISKIGAAMCKSSFKNLRSKFDYAEVGGAPLLGLNALVVKAHGSSDAKAIKGAIKQCAAFLEKDITERIIGLMAKG